VGVRCLEIRGTGEAITTRETDDPTSEPATTLDGAIIRIHSRRIISFGLDNADIDPHLLVPSKRDIPGS